jgi:hypothetical protein
MVQAQVRPKTKPSKQSIYGNARPESKIGGQIRGKNKAHISVNARPEAAILMNECVYTWKQTRLDRCTLDHHQFAKHKTHTRKN